MPVPHQTHPDQFEIQLGLLDHPFGQKNNFLFIARYSSPWTNSVRSSREVHPLERMVAILSIVWLPATRRTVRYVPHTAVVYFHSLSDLFHVCHNDRIKFTISFCFFIFWDDISNKPRPPTVFALHILPSLWSPCLFIFSTQLNITFLPSEIF